MPNRRGNPVGPVRRAVGDELLRLSARGADYAVTETSSDTLERVDCIRCKGTRIVASGERLHAKGFYVKSRFECTCSQPGALL